MFSLILTGTTKDKSKGKISQNFVATKDKSKGKISQNFVAFSEYMDFNYRKYGSISYLLRCKIVIYSAAYDTKSHFSLVSRSYSILITQAKWTRADWNCFLMLKVCDTYSNIPWWLHFWNKFWALWKSDIFWNFCYTWDLSLHFSCTWVIDMEFSR